MQGPDVHLSPERLQAIHQMVQEAKPPKGWRWLGYTLRGNMKGRLLPVIEDFFEVGKEIGLDKYEMSVFGFSAKSRLGEYIAEGFVDNSSVNWQKLLKATGVANVDRLAGSVSENISVVEKSVSQIYKKNTNMGDDIARKHLGLVTKFGSVAAFILYQTEIDPQFALRVVTNWNARIYQSRDALGYMPFYPK